MSVNITSTHVITTSWKNGNGVPVTRAVRVTADNEVNQNPVIAASATNAPMAPITLTRAKLQSVFIVANVNCTIRTNSGTAPTDTIALVAGIPVAWTIGQGIGSCPFSADVTALFGTNAGATMATVVIRIAANN